MKKLEELKELRKNVFSIRNFLNVSIQKYKSDSRIDKLGYGFNIDGRFSACKGVTITFDSLVGSYGSSDCSTIVRLSPDIFNKHLLKYLNVNKHLIMEKIADSIEKEAKALRQEAEKELQSELDKLKELGDADTIINELNKE